MDVLTSETCCALNNEIIKQVTSSWSLFIQLVTLVAYFKHLRTRKIFLEKKQAISADATQITSTYI